METVKLSPKIRSESVDNQIPPIALQTIKPFLNHSRVVSKQTLEQAPVIIAHAGEHVVAGAGDQIYVEGLHQYQNSHLSDFAILRKNHVYIDPQTKQTLGYEALDVGQAHLTEPGDPATLIITQSKMEILRGDKLMPPFEDYDLALHPQIPKYLIEGQIIGVMGGVTQIGQYQVVVVNRGYVDKILAGDIFAVFQQARKINNPDKNSRQRTLTLPAQRAGEMMIFRTFERVSYGLILQATRPIHLFDTFKTPLE